MVTSNEYLNHDRVRRHTDARVQQSIDETTAHNIRRYAEASAEACDARTAELGRQWDMERVLETNASILALTGVALAATVNRKFLIIPGVVLGFLLEHAISGWCPPVPLFRRMGVRTRTEIDQEYYALKALRGDFEGIQSGSPDADRAIGAVME